MTEEVVVGGGGGGGGARCHSTATADLVKLAPGRDFALNVLSIF